MENKNMREFLVVYIKLQEFWIKKFLEKLPVVEISLKWKSNILIAKFALRLVPSRYKRRGVDENGEVANYVETEQIVSYQSHEVSFIQVRGSVPVYWSQPGFKYRPPPRIDKGKRNAIFFHSVSLIGSLFLWKLVSF